MSSTFCSSQLNQYVPCGPCWWIMITGCLREISHFLSGKRQNGKLPTRSSLAGAKTVPPAPQEGRTCVSSFCVTAEKDESLSTRNRSGVCAQAHTNSPRGHGPGQPHAKFTRGTSLRFPQRGNKEAIKMSKDSSAVLLKQRHHTISKNVALKMLLSVPSLPSCD